MLLLSWGSVPPLCAEGIIGQLRVQQGWAGQRTLALAHPEGPLQGLSGAAACGPPEQPGYPWPLDPVAGGQWRRPSPC